MKIGIICASDSELEPFLALLEDDRISEKAMLKVHEGKISGVEAAAVFCGVCKVNAAVASQILIDCYNVDMIINAGTAGGMRKDIKIFDSVISEEAIYHDVNEEILTGFHPWMKTPVFKADERLLELSRKAAKNRLSGGNVYWGRIVTGEAFITDNGRREINEKYMPLAVDMESAGIAHVCYVNSIPFIVVRTITDTEDHSGAETFELNCKSASVISKDIVESLILEISHNKDKF